MKQKRQKQTCQAKTLASQCARAIVPCLVLILLLTAGSCKDPGKDPDEKRPLEDQSITGSWKLVELKYPAYTYAENQTVVDYTDSNIIFTFKENNTLQVSGSMQEGYIPEGEYPYRYCVIVDEKDMPEGGYGYDCVIVTDPLSFPGPNLYIDNYPLYSTVSEQKTKLGIQQVDGVWHIELTKLNNK
ncbi:MAG: hypothetical protein LBK03_02065 [Bacteroidales bacterium]|nr:hypothetical protein [Bacteroidales bacterium]